MPTACQGFYEVKAWKRAKRGPCALPSTDEIMWLKPSWTKGKKNRFQRMSCVGYGAKLTFTFFVNVNPSSINYVISEYTSNPY